MATLNPITARIIKFKQDLRNQSISELSIVRKHISFGTPYIFHDNEEKYFCLKEEVANIFNISPSSLMMIGSSKLGFSIAPGKRWRHITNESDIDITIINQKLFDEYWEELFKFNINLTPHNETEGKRYTSFLQYFFKGWIRPDLFDFKNPKRLEWFNKLRPVYNKYDNRKISVGIFRNEYFFESYQILNIKNIRKGGGLK